MKPFTLGAVLATALALSVTGCGKSTTPSVGETPASNTNAYTVDLEPADFPTSTTIDNPYYPLIPGTRYIFEGTGTDGPEKNTTQVSRDTKMINGIKAIVVHDFVTRAGELAEDTYDWYAQDKGGNVWYLGEDTHKRSDKTGKLNDTMGSWVFGKDGAVAGMIMKANPKVGETYRQEYRKGHAEDQATILRTDDTATVKAGSYQNAVRTKDFSELDPSVVEEKQFALGVGFISVVHVKGPAEKSELVIEKF